MYFNQLNIFRNISDMNIFFLMAYVQKKKKKKKKTKLIVHFCAPWIPYFDKNDQHMECDNQNDNLNKGEEASDINLIWFLVTLIVVKFISP